MITPTTITQAPEVDAAGRPSRTLVRVELEPRGRVAVHADSTSAPGRPRVRAALLSASPTGARVCLVPEGALLLAGDQVEVVVEVGAGASLELVETAGTVAYDMRGDRARWDVDVRIGDGGTLVWGGEPFVVAGGADVGRATRVELGAAARITLRETLVLGRYGEAPGLLRQRLDVTGPAGVPVLVEELGLDGASSAGVLGGHRVLASVLALGADIPEDSAPEHRYDLDGGGTWWRRLGHDVHRTVPDEAWRAAQRACRG